MVHSIWNNDPEIAQGLQEVKRILKRELRIKLPEIETKIKEYMDAPGKYLRAGLCLMFARLQSGEISQDKLYLAAALEALHLATLIHDDVIDEADTRRGIQALHKHESNRVAIYAGDYLMTYAARLASHAFHRTNEMPLDPRIMEQLLVGELNQLANQFRMDMSVYDYLRQIRGKTALLFATATFAGYYDVHQSAWQRKQAFYVGQAIGMAFQLTDDLLDYRIHAAKSGKPQLQDVQNGIYTLPLIIAMNEPHSPVRHLLKQRGEIWTSEELTQLEDLLEQYNAYERTEQLVEDYLNKAIQRLHKMSDPYQYVNQIEQLISDVMQRNF